MFGIKKIKVFSEKTKEELAIEKATRNFGLFPADYERLCREVKVGNELNFNKLYLAHFKKIRNYTAKLCKVFFATQVENAVEMAFVIFFRRIKSDSIPTYNELEGYVVRCAEREYYREQRSSQQNSKIKFQIAWIPKNLAVRDDFDVDISMVAKESFQKLCSFCRGILTDIHLNGFSYQEVQEKRGFPNPQTLEVKHSSIKLKLREAFLNPQTDAPICQKLCETGKNKKDI